ncbi:isocitrate/isopropylmalate family dehydrogenase, partial [Ruminococcus sp.]|uniref:isocitrate/isopropylmalate family dehydrogenase n=1 Tax=Ruminococcus sp. TaxID=41978 RepID=UPI001B5E343C
YYRYLNGEKTSTNPVATIFAWTGALRKRAELDTIPELCEYAGNLEKAILQTISEGIMTGDLASISKLRTKQTVDTETFLIEVGKRLNSMYE